jgi:hypothetical protein
MSVKEAKLSPFTGIGDILKRKKGQKNDTKHKRKKAKTQQEQQPEPEPKPRPKPKPKKKKQDQKKLAGRKPEDRRLIAILTAFGKNEWLGPYLLDSHDFDLTPAKLRRMSGTKLAELHDDVEDVLANKSNSALGDGVVRQTMHLLEGLAMMRTKYQIEGTTDKCFQNDHWRFLLERTKMKYGIGVGNLDPVAELSLITFQTASMLHFQNAMSTPTINLDEEVEMIPEDTVLHPLADYAK